MIRTYRISDTVIPSKLNAARGRLMPKIGRFKNEASKQAYESIYRELESTWPVPSTHLDVPTSFGPTHVRRSGTGTARSEEHTPELQSLMRLSYADLSLTKTTTSHK